MALMALDQVKYLHQVFTLRLPTISSLVNLIRLCLAFALVIVVRQVQMQMDSKLRMSWKASRLTTMESLLVMVELSSG